MVAAVQTRPMQVVKEKLVSIEAPKNQILARLQNKFNDRSDNRAVSRHSRYSRMHNRHNRS